MDHRRQPNHCYFDAEAVNRVLKLAKKHEDAVEIVANNADGSLCAHLPINALHLFILPSKTGEVSAVHDILEEEAEEEKA